MKYFKLFLILPLVLLIYTSGQPIKSTDVDEIIFINVGQGHAVLVNKVGFSQQTETENPLPWSPLLIDAGSTSHTYEQQENHTWGKDEKGALVIHKISEKILGFWQKSHNNSLPGGQYHLNIIITHPDEDHKVFISNVLNELEQKKTESRFSFTTFILLGGNDPLYRNFLPNVVTKKYSNSCVGIFCKDEGFEKEFGDLAKSGCITHLFCPKGIKSDPNRWSIVTRLEINGISAILTGDADATVKEEMLEALAKKQKKEMLAKEQHDLTELKSDILLLSHHGAENTYHKLWDEIINAKAIIIGSAPRTDYKHPRGKTIMDLLNQLKGQGRIWEDKVTPHGIQYWSDESDHNLIKNAFYNHQERLFDCVPNNIGDHQQAATGSWHLIWVDIPIYTLWTTGTLSFQESISDPHFIDAPAGIMPYVAVFDPIYLLSPEIRSLATPLTCDERKQCERLSNVVAEKYIGNPEDAVAIKNSIISSMLSIRTSEDRSSYFHVITILLNQGEFLHLSPLFLQWVKEAVIERNKKVDKSGKRVRDAAKYMIPLLDDEEAAPEDPRGTWEWQWNHFIFKLHTSINLDEKALILKTFSKSLADIKHLQRYIETYMYIAHRGIPNADIEISCPFGFPEWLHLRRVAYFFSDITLLESPRDIDGAKLDEGIRLMDFIDIKALRIQGKSFKEIAEAIKVTYIRLVDEGILDGRIYIPAMGNPGNRRVTSQEFDEILNEILKDHFPDNLDLL